MKRRATPVLQFKHILANGAIVQVRIWRLPSPTAERLHGHKYSLFYGRPGERVIGYDNETGKGDHRHYRQIEEPYHFISIDRLLADFEADVAREIRRERDPDQG